MKLFAGILLMTVALQAGSAWSEIPAAPALPKPIFTRQSAFMVPFVMDPAEAGARRAVEVQLHVSENGAPWKLYAKAAPTTGSILFRASRDGEYRFMVRTKDDHGELQPAGPPHPELIVMVDTDPPVLELTAERGSGAEVRARWRVRDAYLRPESLHLEFQVGPDGPWNTVAIDPPALGATSSAREATWVPEAREVAITIRAEVSDYAGNIAKSQRIIPGLRPRRDPATTAQASQSTDADMITRWPAERTQNTPLGPADPPSMPDSYPWRAGAERSLAGGGRRFQSWGEEVLPRERMPEPETLPAPESRSELALPSPSTERRLPVPGQPEEVELPPAPSEARRAAPRTRRETDATDGPRLPGPESIPTSTDNYGQARTLPVDESVAPLEGEVLPPGAQPRMISARRIELDYDVETAAPGGVRRVDIWGTRDGGRTWQRIASDEDNRSPAVVTVDTDGIFGFRIVVEAANGASDVPPHAGDAPDVTIGVDTTKPMLRLTGTDAGAGDQAGTVSIRWEASDSMLGRRPISLFTSRQATGPWAPIGVDLENNGQFVWRPDPGTPELVYLRVEARDLAGNAEVIDTPEPVSVVPQRPRGHIRSVRPGG